MLPSCTGWDGQETAALLAASEGLTDAAQAPLSLWLPHVHGPTSACTLKDSRRAGRHGCDPLTSPSMTIEGTDVWSTCLSTCHHCCASTAQPETARLALRLVAGWQLVPAPARAGACWGSAAHRQAAAPSLRLPVAAGLCLRCWGIPKGDVPTGRRPKALWCGHVQAGSIGLRVRCRQRQRRAAPTRQGSTHQRRAALPTREQMPASKHTFNPISSAGA